MPTEMLTNIQVQILKRIAPVVPDHYDKSAYESKSKLAVVMGNDFFVRIAGKTVFDFGCGDGADAIEMAEKGAKRVVGIEIREELLDIARARARSKGLEDRCFFTSSTNETADVVVSVDAFEHFSDPAGILRIMDTLLQAQGEVRISFGPTWRHPLGGHLFSVFPWAHLIFTEKALIRWRSTFKSDGATCFGEVAGGLNQMTIARFEALVAVSPFRLVRMELVPIRKLRLLHNRFTREFTTAVVRCRLTRKASSGPRSPE